MTQVRLWLRVNAHWRVHLNPLGSAKAPKEVDRGMPWGTQYQYRPWPQSSQPAGCSGDLTMVFKSIHSYGSHDVVPNIWYMFY